MKKSWLLMITFALLLSLSMVGVSLADNHLTDATGSRSGNTDTTPPIIYVSPASFSEGFDDITNLPGWYMQNNSSPPGLIGWFQGNDGVFPAHAGAPDAYIGANFNNTSGIGTISNWLLTPEQPLGDGATFSFWTRTADLSNYPDRLQVRLSTSGASTDVGISAEDVGVFTTLLLDINPTLVIGGYPEVWTQYSITLSSIPPGATGRLGFRYYVTNGGPDGANSNYIGIDTVEYTAQPDIEITPLSLHAEQPTDSITQQNLQICNVGLGTLAWVIGENPGILAGSMPFTPVSVEAKTEVPQDISVSFAQAEIAVPSQPANPDAVLWDQPISGVNQNAYVNQDFSDFPTYSSFLADDFVNTESWTVQSIFIPGNGWNGFTTLMNATSLTWQIYADSGGVPAGDPSGGGALPLWTMSLAPTDPSVVITNGSGGFPSNTQLNLSTPIILPPGHYWLVFYPTLTFTPGGQFGRQPADTTNGYTGQFINPGGAFGYGTVWQNWTVLGPLQTDIAFRLEGEIVQIPWLDETPKSGALDAGVCTQVKVTFNSTGLALGTYTGALLVNSNDPDDPSINIPVTLDVVAPPDISITPTLLQSTQAPNTIKSQTLPICNVAGGSLNWNLWEDSGMLNQGISIPASDGNVDQGDEPVSVGIAPSANQGAPAPEHGFVLAGEPAYAIDLLSGKNVVYIPNTMNPGSWDVVVNRPGNEYFAGDFITGDFTTLYVIDNILRELHAINTTTGAVTVVGPSLPIGSQTVTGMSWDPTTDTMYATATTGVVASLYTIDLTTGTPTFVADIAGAPFAIDIAFNSQGVLYTHEINLDVIMTINKTNGATTIIGPTGFSANFAQGMDFEDNTGILYLSAYNAALGRGELRVVDTSTGATALIGPFPGGTEVDAFAFATGHEFDILWLSESPVSGTVAAGDCQNVTVTFDSTGLPLGLYTGVLKVYSNDPDESMIIIQVTLNVGYHEFFLPIVLR